MNILLLHIHPPIHPQPQCLWESPWQANPPQNLRSIIDSRQQSARLGIDVSIAPNGNHPFAHLTLSFPFLTCADNRSFLLFFFFVGFQFLFSGVQRLPIQTYATDVQKTVWYSAMDAKVRGLGNSWDIHPHHSRLEHQHHAGKWKQELEVGHGPRKESANHGAFGPSGKLLL